MKQIYILAIILTTIIFFGCDQMDQPLRSTKPTPIDSGNYKKIIIEEYTGFRCKNCPEASDLAHSLLNQYTNRVIILSVHAGSYAKPTSTHTYDFRTTVGNDLDAFFAICQAGNPNGMINRRAVDGARIVPPSKWESGISLFLKELAPVNLKLTSSYNENTRKIDISCDIKYNQASNPNQYICLYILEDSIVQYQDDKRQTPEDVYDYVHENVLRGSINGTWGDQITASTIPAGEKITKTFSYEIPSDKDWRCSKLKILAFVHDMNGTYEILQAEEVPLIPVK